LISFWFKFGWNPRDVNFLKMTKYSCKLQIQISNDLPRRVWCAVMLCFWFGKSWKSIIPKPMAFL
jgi:hypothetical protein